MSFHRLGEILPQALAGLGIVERVRRERLAHIWPAVARSLSESLAAESAVVALEGETLAVEVASERAAALVAEHEAELLAGLRAQAAESGVTGIQVRYPASGGERSR